MKPNAYTGLLWLLSSPDSVSKVGILGHWERLIVAVIMSWDLRNWFFGNAFLIDFWAIEYACIKLSWERWSSLAGRIWMRAPVLLGNMFVFSFVISDVYLSLRLFCFYPEWFVSTFWYINLFACFTGLCPVWSIFIFCLVSIASYWESSALLDPLFDICFVGDRILKSLEPVLTYNTLIGKSVQEDAGIFWEAAVTAAFASLGAQTGASWASIFVDLADIIVARWCVCEFAAEHHFLLKWLRLVTDCRQLVGIFWCDPNLKVLPMTSHDKRSRVFEIFKVFYH
jgi:hypothetical protein